MNLTPDSIILWQGRGVTLNATLLFTWLIMLGLTLGCWAVTRQLEVAKMPLSPWQNFLEAIVSLLREQIREISEQDPEPFLPFIGSPFPFVAVSNVLSLIPGYIPPTGSLSTTAALSICVFVAVPIYGIRRQGVLNYLRQYLEPTPIMLPFNIVGEFSRTLALAVRLFGNVMSGTMIVGILLSIAPLFFPVIMQLMGLLTGLIQAYIFAVLAMVYIGAATRVQKPLQSSYPSTE
jgi:F-type H+-transporting ATPase subunit a